MDLLHQYTINQRYLFAKIFDNLVTNKVSTFFYRFIIDELHGFMNGKSTTSDLACFKEEITGILNKNSQMDAMYTEL